MRTALVNPDRLRQLLVHIIILSLAMVVLVAGIANAQKKTGRPDRRGIPPEEIQIVYIEYPELMGTNIIDLNDDGIQDTIRYEVVDSEDYGYGFSFTLSINSDSFVGRGEVLRKFYKIVDIDSMDKMKEIAIFEEGPSEDPAWYFFHYDGKSIIPIGIIEGANPKIDGSGILKTSSRGRILCTWWHEDFFKLSQNNKLEHIEQDLYPMNVSVIMKDSLALQRSRTDTTTIIVLVPGEKVLITMTDDKKWCMVESLRGIRGWFAIDNVKVKGYIIRGTDKHTWEIFWGLPNAD